jgi:hypothetical protein
LVEITGGGEARDEGAVTGWLARGGEGMGSRCEGRNKGGGPEVLSGTIKARTMTSVAPSATQMLKIIPN